MIKCAGCEREALYEVFETNQPHCLEHLLEAIDCSVYVHVRRLDELATFTQSQRESGFCGHSTCNRVECGD
ncbi:hypothetical protein D3C81_358580 [compost metagenome]